MTEQPQPAPVEEAQPTGTVSAPQPGEQTHVQPPQVEAPPQYRFFVRLQDNPDYPNYLKPQSLHRLEETETDLFTHRFERESRTWVHNPGLVAFTGIGGADDYEEIDQDKANALIAQWQGEEVEGEVPEEEVPEEVTEEGEVEEEEETDPRIKKMEAGE